MPIETNPTKTIAAVFLLPKCDMGCSFCGSELGFDRIGFDQAKRLFGELYRAGYRNLVLGGGEPALWRDGPHGLGDLAAEAKALGFLVQVNTNAIQLAEDPEGNYLTWQGVDRFIFPMDAANSKAHDKQRIILGRNPTGHFDLIARRVAECSRAGREMTFGTVLTEANRDQVPEMIALLQARLAVGARIHAWHLYRFQAVGRGGVAAMDQLTIQSSDYARACAQAKAAGLPFAVYKRDDMLHSSTVEFFWFEAGQLRTGTSEWGLAPEALS